MAGCMIVLPSIKKTKNNSKKQKEVPNKKMHKKEKKKGGGVVNKRLQKSNNRMWCLARLYKQQKPFSLSERHHLHDFDC
jgi:starvation-inducible outer membrane lipoprotein